MAASATAARQRASRSRPFTWKRGTGWQQWGLSSEQRTQDIVWASSGPDQWHVPSCNSLQRHQSSVSNKHLLAFVLTAPMQDTLKRRRGASASSMAEQTPGGSAAAYPYRLSSTATIAGWRKHNAAIRALVQRSEVVGGWPQRQN